MDEDRGRDRENSRSPVRGGSNGDHGNGDGGGNKNEGNLFLGNLSFDTTERDLEDAFGKYGRISKVRVITDRNTGKPRGFGFISFEDPRDAEDAQIGMQGVNLQGREIRVDKTEPKSKREGGRGGGDYGRSNGGGGTRGGFDNREKALCRLYLKGDCKYGTTCRFAHDNGRGGDDRFNDRDNGWSRGDRDSRRDRDYDRRRDDSRDRRDSRRDDSRDRRDSRRDSRRDDSRDRRESRRDDDRRDSRRDRDYDDRRH